MLLMYAYASMQIKKPEGEGTEVFALDDNQQTSSDMTDPIQVDHVEKPSVGLYFIVYALLRLFSYYIIMDHYLIEVSNIKVVLYIYGGFC